MTTPLRGVIAPLLTPLVNHGRLDVAHLEKLLDYVLRGGVHGLFLFGTTGEGPSLGRDIKCEAIERTAEIIQGRVPILVNVSDTSFVESIYLAKYATDHGTAALVITAPYYFPIEQEDLWLYLGKLTSALPLPFYLYNMPSHTKAGFGLEVVRRAIDQEKIIGIKDSSGERGYLRQLITLGKQRSDWSVFVGPEELFVEAIQGGAQGGILGGANLYPRLLVDLFIEASNRDEKRLAMLSNKLSWFHQNVYRVCPGPNGWLIGLKTMLAMLGLCQEVFAEPLHQSEPIYRAQLKANVTQLRFEGEY
jgi:4-hydroxy-tetrahydrodipicolinate synthase